MANNEGRQAIVTPVIAYSFSFNLDQTRENMNNVVVQFHVPVDESVDNINGILDKVVSTIERQKASYILDTLRKDVELNERALKQASLDLDAVHNEYQQQHIASGKKGSYKPTGIQATKISTAKNNFEHMKNQISRQRIMIAQLEEKRGVTSANHS